MINSNVKTFYLFTGLQSIGRGIWMGNILSLYIVLLAEGTNGILGFSPNELLGITSAVSGAAVLVSVLPGGLLADKWSLKGTLILAFIAGTAGLAVLALGDDLIAIGAGLFLWGVFQGFSRPAAETLLANSTVSGKRSAVYTRTHQIDQICMGIGPLLNIILFLTLGDRWELSILRTVMNVGLVFSFLSALVILNIRHSHSLGEESEALLDKEKPVSDNQGKQNETAPLDKRSRFRRYIPHVFLASSLTIGIGAGMTVKFFPVFFRAIYALRPIAVQIVMAVGLLATALASAAAQRVSLRIGRGETIIAVQSLAILFLVILSFYPPLWVMVPVFALRGALMNAANPLSRSIVMDYVPKKNRGIWNGLQSVAWGLFWNVSAMLGGFLIGEDNFRLCFLITACVYTVGVSLIIPMARVVHRE